MAQRRTHPSGGAGPARNRRPVHGVSLRALAAILAGLAAAPGTLRAYEGTFGIQAGGVMPLGGIRQWVGSGPGVSVDFFDSFDLTSGDDLRMRLGYYSWQGIGPSSQSITLPGDDEAPYPTSANNQFYAVTYGVDYLHPLSPKVYLIGGLGAAYLTASRSGTLDLTSVGAGPTNYRYDANKLSPYACAGAGVPLHRGIAVEGRFQATSLPRQVRNVDLTKAGYSSPGQVTFPGFVATSFVLGLTFTF